MNPTVVQQTLQAISEWVGRALFGAEDLTRHSFIALLTRGHVLLEGPPGTGKTLFARTFARLLGLGTRRIQCTPDLMPGDVLGANIFDFRTQKFSLTQGPVFTEFLLADEINRTPPKTQSALLEAMQERAVTIDGVTHALPARFMLVGTQNPLEHEGTYPLPEAQLDRFLFKLIAGYPSEAEELAAVLTHGTTAAMPDLERLGIQPVVTGAHIDAFLAVPATIRLEDSVARYAVALGRSTRQHRSLAVGISPRAVTMLSAAARAAAACDGRDYVVPDDLKALFVAVARHRVILTPAADVEGIDVETVLREILAQTPAPR